MENRKKRVMVIGSGGRCHAIAEAFGRSPLVEKIYCTPGNPGMGSLGENVNIGATDIKALADFAEQNGIDLTVAGPEASLCAGVADEFNRRGLRLFGPGRDAAQIEGSKGFAKDIMERAGVPTAAYRSFTDYDEAVKFVKSRPLPAVIKYDGLAAGKGVVVASSYEEADEALRDMLLHDKFGEGKVIVEDFLDGEEFSFMAFVNGDKVYPLVAAKDHKRAFDGDEGPNTGGMGAYSPVAFVDEAVENEVMEKIMRPVAREMVKNGTPFLGVLYGGLIMTKDGPKVIEFNARFGDPETEVVLPRLKSDLYSFMEAVIEGRSFEPEWSDEVCLGIVLATKGYPGDYGKGYPVSVEAPEGVRLYHMGTAEKEGSLLSSGGRVMIAVAEAGNIPQARTLALEALEKASGENFFYRKDIGLK